MKRIVHLLLVVYCLLFIVPAAHAEYVFPYPSYMPGNKLYAVSRILDTLEQYWHWGNIASYRYHLELADKYLIEAKTLFEYRQYLLAVDALERSNTHTEKLPVFLKRAAEEKKDISRERLLGREALAAHVLLMDDLTGKLPDSFLWEPEKTASTELKFSSLMRRSVNLRETVADIITGL